MKNSQNMFENRTIEFNFEDQRYQVPVGLTQFNYILLPDRRILQVQGWMEVFPPIPRGFKVVESNNGQTMNAAMLLSVDTSLENNLQENQETTSGNFNKVAPHYKK